MSSLESAASTAGTDSFLAMSIERCAIAIGRLDARVSASSLASGWEQRAAWSGYARALQLQSVEIDEIDVFSWACNLPLPSRQRRPSHGDEFAGFRPWIAALGKADGHHWRDRLPFAPNDAPTAPLLLRAVGICHDYARRDGGIAPWLALPTILHGLGTTQSPLPCLVAGAKAFRWRATLSDDMTAPILRSLAGAAAASLKQLDAMESDHRRSMIALRDEFRPTSLAGLVALLAMRPLISPQAAAGALDLTLGGAGKLLSRAAELKLVVEITGRRAWRIYLAPDLAVFLGFTAPARGRPPKAETEPAFDRGLDKAIEAFDREMAEIEKRLAALG